MAKQAPDKNMGLYTMSVIIIIDCTRKAHVIDAGEAATPCGIIGGSEMVINNYKCLWLQ